MAKPEPRPAAARASKPAAPARAPAPRSADAAPHEDARELAAAAFEPSQHDRVAEAIQQLSPEEAQVFLDVLEKSLERRRLQLWGYILSGIVLMVGMLGVLLYWGAAPEGTFVGWTVCLPFLAVGVILWTFGRLSNRIK